MTSLALMDNVIDLAGTQQEAASEPEEEEEEEDYDQTDSFYQLDSLLADCVSELGSVWGVMAVHGVYLSAYLRAQHLLLHSNSAPLPAPHRHMIGMMASARLSCAYLLAQHRAQLTLLAARGSSAGVSVAQLDRGLASFPAKVRKLSCLNMLLAHRPWQMTREHVAQLTQPGPDSWSLSELVYSIILMCHVHSLSSFVMSCVMMEPDTGDTSARPSPAQDSYRVEELMRRMSVLRCRQDSPPPQEELQNRFYSIRGQSSETECWDHAAAEADLSLYAGDVNFQYVDFAKRQDESATFRIQDFTWDEEGYSTIARFDEDTAQCLDDKFRTIYNLTYGTMGGHTSIDTSLFRRASWNYIQAVWGVRHDDYDYHEVNELLHRDLKNYIKTSSCYPDRCTKSDYENIMKDFQDSEKIHVMMLVAEAKFQSSLLYAMRAVSEYYNTS